MKKELEDYRQQAIEEIKKEEEKRLLDMMQKLQKEDENLQLKDKQEACSHEYIETDNHGRDKWCSSCGFVVL